MVIIKSRSCQTGASTNMHSPAGLGLLQDILSGGGTCVSKVTESIGNMAHGGFRSEVRPRRQHWFLNEKSGFPFRTPAFCSVSRGQRRLGEKEYRAALVHKSA